MSKFMLFVCIVLLASTIITAAPDSCIRHGGSCTSTSQCCAKMACHTYAHRCQVQITEEELAEGRRKVLGRTGKDY